MQTLSKSDVAGGRRIDGVVTHVTDSAIWVRENDGREDSIRWPGAYEDVRVGHRISAFVAADGTGHQVRNHATGRVMSTFSESVPEAHAWAGFGALGDKGLTVALIPLFNYLMLIQIALLCLTRHFRTFVKGAVLFGVMTLPFMYLGAAADAQRRFNLGEAWVARGLVLAGVLVCAWIAWWGLRQIIRGGWFAKIVGLLALMAFGGIVALFGAGAAIMTGLVSVSAEIVGSGAQTYSLLRFIDELARDIPFLPLGLLVLAFAPTVTIIYAMREIAASSIREHNGAVALIDAKMAG